MRTKFSYFLCLLSFCGCGSFKSPEITDKTFNPPTDSLYLSCADLKGLSQYEVGKTTLKQLKKDKDYLNSNTFELLRDDNNLFNGHWGSNYFHSTDYDKFQWMEKQSKNKIRQVVPQSLGYSIDDIEFDDFDMAFLNDTLVAIYFTPKDKFANEILQHFKDKFGTGKGTYYSYHLDNEPCKDRDLLMSETTTKEHLIWENADVALQYDNEEHFKMGPNIKTEFYHFMSYLVYSKDRYPVFEEKLKELATAYDNLKAEEKSSTIGSL